MVQHGNVGAQKLGHYELSSAKLNIGLETVRAVSESSRVSTLQKSTAFKNLVESRTKDRLLSKAQLYWTSELAVPRLDQAVLQLELERFLVEKYPDVEWNLDDYCWTEAMSADTLAQVYYNVDLGFPFPIHIGPSRRQGCIAAAAHGVFRARRFGAGSFTS